MLPGVIDLALNRTDGRIGSQLFGEGRGESRCARVRVQTTMKTEGRISRETSVPHPASFTFRSPCDRQGGFSAGSRRYRKSNQPVESNDQFSTDAINPRLFVNFIS